MAPIESPTLGPIPLGVLIDSYKASHSSLYPPAQEQVAYGEFRCSFDRDPTDHRILFYGLNYIIDNYIARRWTAEDVEASTKFFATHNVGHSSYPFPTELLRSVVEECDGWFPVKIEGLAEGTICYPHTPVYTVTAKGKYSGLVTWLETLISMVWYPTTVATLSRRIRDVIRAAFVRSVESKYHFLVESRLHDFGFRGCASVEQAMIGGTAHLLSFKGTDTAIAAYHAQVHLNGGVPVAESIPATEHSIMLAHADEREAIMATIQQYGEGTFAIVMDSYDYRAALERILPSVAAEKLAKGGFMVVRPDSGDAQESVLAALKSLELVFGVELNSLGYKVLKGCGVIQGDGVDYQQISRILGATMDAGYSAQNVAFGMGSALLHRGVNRDSMSFATKLSYVQSVKGVGKDICKAPRTDAAKISLPGRFTLRRDAKGRIVVYPKDGDNLEGTEVLQILYDHGPVTVANGRSFDQIRSESLEHWEKAPKIFDPVSSELKSKQSLFVTQVHQQWQERT